MKNDLFRWAKEEIKITTLNYVEKNEHESTGCKTCGMWLEQYEEGDLQTQVQIWKQARFKINELNTQFRNIEKE